MLKGTLYCLYKNLIIQNNSLLKSKSNNFINNKKLDFSFFKRQIIYHQFTKVTVLDLRRTATINSAGLCFIFFFNTYLFDQGLKNINIIFKSIRLFFLSIIE